MDYEPHANPKTETATASTNRRATFFRLFLPAVVLVTGAAIAAWMFSTGPKAKPRPKVRNATLVEVKLVDFAPQTTRVRVMGTVQPSHMIELRSQVSGEVIGLHPDFIPGGQVQEGTTLVQVDPADYQLAIRQQTSEIARVEADVQLEQGNQLVARKEYELLGETVSPEERSLMLREPQLASLEAALDAARARLDRARLDLERTAIKAPFNAVVQTRQANLGTRVNTTTPLATLVGTDTYWVEALVPVNQLRWIRIPRGKGQHGSQVRIYDEAAWGADRYREGEVIRLVANLEEQGRMARLLVQVDDPLALETGHHDQPAMLIGSYVRVEIEGEPLQNVATIDRNLIRDNDTVWVMDENDRLVIRPVTIVFRDRDHVLVDGGLTPGERLVTSILSTPVDGMALRLNDSPATAPDPGQTGKSE